MRAAIGLGANVGDTAATLGRALRALRRIGTVARVSPFYRSRAWGVTEQPDFLNAVALLDTTLAPHALLAELKAIERNLGRVATYRWGPRVVDLDILTYGAAVIDSAELTIPHARMRERAFVLAPLSDLDPAYGAALASLPAGERDAVQRIPPPAARTEPSVDWDQTLERVRSAAEFCASAELARFRVDEADLEIEIRRSPRPAEPVAAELVGDDAAAANGVAPSANGAGTHDAPPAKVLKAEFVGIVRLARPAVAEGAELAQDRELAYVESLGIRNPIRAGGPGRIAQIFVTDGQAVEYGQPLFAIETKPA